MDGEASLEIGVRQLPFSCSLRNRTSFIFSSHGATREITLRTSHTCASFFLRRVHSRLALMPRPSEPLMSRLAPPAVPDSSSPTPM